jgi:hypothetical protein
MTNNDFKYWLQGFIELSGNECKIISRKQMLIILNHIRLTEAVSKKLTEGNKQIKKIVLEKLLEKTTLDFQSLKLGEFL